MAVTAHADAAANHFQAQQALMVPRWDMGWPWQVAIWASPGRANCPPSFHTACQSFFSGGFDNWYNLYLGVQKALYTSCANVLQHMGPAPPSHDSIP